jgi:acyl dehydratase
VVAVTYPTITDEALDELRTRIGREFQGPDPWLTEVTRDAVRHFAWGVGDRNPLWLDPAYAEASRFGTLVAPPSILYAFDRVVSGYVGGLPGIHAMFAGSKFRWYRELRLGDRLVARSKLKELVEHQSSFSGRAIQQIYEVNFFDEHGQRVATVDSWCFRTQRAEARARRKYQYIEAQRYTDEDLARIEDLYAREEIRGATPRYWDDVEPGDSMGPIVKGPLTITSVVAFDQGWGGLYLRAHAYAFELYRRHPALALPNAAGIPEPPERVHWDSELAKEVGVPAAYDYGPERVSWLINLLTNWVGDDGSVLSLDAQVRRFNLLGDTTYIHGRVTRKWVDDEDGRSHRVECSLWAEDQRGEVTAKATGVVALPSR